MRQFRTALCTAALCVWLTACGQSQPVAPVETSGQTESRAEFPVKRCINMGNALEAPIEGDWGYHIEAEHFDIIAAAGFDTVRIPIRWDAHTASAPPYKIDPAFMSRVKTVARQARNAGLGVIINVHHYEALMEDTAGQLPRFLAMWDQISEEFKDAPDSLYFEPINESIAPMTMAMANDLYAKVLPRIRPAHPKRPVIIGGDDWNNVQSLKHINLPEDPYLVATFHDYEPYKFTHQGASWMEKPPRLGRKWGRRTDVKNLRADYELAAAYRTRTGVPVFSGEFGVIDTVPNPQRAKWLEARRRTAEAAGISWCVWDFGGAFKLYDLEKNQWQPGLIEALMEP